MKALRELQFTAIVAATIVAASPHGTAQDLQTPDELRKLCETTLCRKPGGVVRLTLDSGKPFETRIDGPQPITQDGQVFVFAGETIFVEAEIDGDHLTILRGVETNNHPEKTLTFHLSQEAGTPAMTLVVTNPFPKMVKYHAGMMLPMSEKLLKTSTCPVMGNGRMAFESWPNAIFRLVLFDFRLLDENTTQMSCEF
jgi:hypothetical protein